MNGDSENRWPEARELAESLAQAVGEELRCVLLYGSRLNKTRPDRHSALDFVVIVRDYRSFYRALAEAGEMHRPVALMTGMARVLAPNVIAYTPEEGTAGIAKCLVVSYEHLERALGPNPPDHFLLGRLVQRTGVVWCATEADREKVAARIAGAQSRVLEWMAPYLDSRFTAASLGERLLEVCYRGELRPESRGRASAVFEAQADHFERALQAGIESARSDGRVVDVDGGYTLAKPASAAEERKWRWHFRKSKTRTTLRWFKHVITFANWLPYVVRKVERHTGRTIELTTLEKKLPVLFLWPRAIHVLVTRPRREIES